MILVTNSSRRSHRNWFLSGYHLHRKSHRLLGTTRHFLVIDPIHSKFESKALFVTVSRRICANYWNPFDSCAELWVSPIDFLDELGIGALPINRPNERIPIETGRQSVQFALKAPHCEHKNVHIFNKTNCDCWANLYGELRTSSAIIRARNTSWFVYYPGWYPLDTVHWIQSVDISGYCPMNSLMWNSVQAL